MDQFASFLRTDEVELEFIALQTLASSTLSELALAKFLSHTFVLYRQVIQHSEVDVFQAVKTVRRHRPQLVDNMVRSLSSSAIPS